MLGGGVFVKHSTKSTVAQPQVDLTFLLFLSEVVEQPAGASNLMLQEALNATGAPFSGTLQLWSDTGPHFRSAENLFFYARKLCQARKQPIQIRWLAEQHGKSILDEMFAWTGTHRDGWLGKHAARFPICKERRYGASSEDGCCCSDAEGPKRAKMDCQKGRLPRKKGKCQTISVCTNLENNRNVMRSRTTSKRLCLQRCSTEFSQTAMTGAGC